MKLLYIANVRFPIEKAHGIQIASMCEAFGKMGAQIELVLPTRNNPDFENVDPFGYYGVGKNFQIKKLQTPDPTWLMRLWPGWYIKTQASLFIFKLNSYLSKLNLENPNFYTRDEYLLPILQKFSGRVTWEAHNLPAKKEYYLKYWQKCYRIIVISRGLKNVLIDLGISEDKILVAPDGVDLEKFSARGRSALGGKVKSEKFKVREKLGLSKNAKIIMYAGHLYEWKGAKTLLDAALNTKFTPSSSPPYQGGEREGVLFVFVGGTEHEITKFRELARGFDNILILGHKPPSEMSKYLAVADILVLPTSGKSDIGKKYTSPMKLFEYMAAGRPIVASDLPSIREVLDESTALFFTPDDPLSLRQKIEELLKDEQLQERLADKALTRVKDFAWDGRARKILQFLAN